MLGIKMLIVIMLYCHVGCLYAQFYYAERIILGVIMLSCFVGCLYGQCLYVE